MADGICRVPANPAEAREMGTRGRKRVEEHFTIEQTAKKVEAVYRRVLRKNGSNRDTSA
jgi:glycosyltransferase involved in cell wall biosynthesis